MSAPAATVDSLVKFRDIKNISFNKSSADEDVQDESGEDVQDESDEDFEPTVVSKSRRTKGSARLKDDADEDSDSASSTRKLKRDVKELGQLYDMFPNVSRAHVKSVFAKQGRDAKSSIDTLLAEAFAKEEQSQQPDRHKRKSSDESANEVVKKTRRMPILSDDEDDEEEEGPSSRQKPKARSAKPKSKKLGAMLSDSMLDDYDEEDKENFQKKKKPTAKKQTKSKTKKKSRRRDEDEYEVVSDQSGNEFAKDSADFDSDDSADEQERMSDGQKAAILSIFNDASVEDIQSMLNITPKRLETLLSLRPFKDFRDLHKRLSQKSLYPVITAAKEIIYARSIVGTMLNRCERISKKMQKQVASQVNGDKNASLDIKFQPKNLNKNLSLKPYQLIGLNWLCLMHHENVNGILADEMGLGKTCQTIAFLAHLLETNKKLMHLIVVPPSTLDNWVREISTWCPSFYFTVYQGNLEERRRLRFDVLNNRFEKPLNGILTSYGLISSTNEDRAFFKQVSFEYCVFDEAHMLKNMNSQRYQSLIQIKSKRKLLLTGTPLQNNLVELMSLLHFVMPDMFQQHQTEHINKIFASKPANVGKDTFYSEKIAQAKGIMAPFILRRLKSDVLKQLPKKVEEIIRCEMTLKQTKDYTALVNYYKQRKDELELLKAEKEKARKEAGVVKDEAARLAFGADFGASSRKAGEPVDDNSNNILMELRKAANHPLLRRNIYTNDKIKEMARLVMKESTPDTVYDYVVEDLSVMSDFQIHKICPLYKGLKAYALEDAAILNSGKFVVLDSLLAEKKETGDRVLLFSQFVIMLDIVEEFLKIKGYKYFRLDGQTAVTERQDMIDNFNNDSEVFIFLLSTKAGGVGINLTAANVVIMHDIDYNPFNDKQAEDRCHRVGQTREVHVYKLISNNSIDESMLRIQKAKLDLGADMSGESGDQPASKADMVSMLKEALKL